jgi:hypothetical protein
MKTSLARTLLLGSLAFAAIPGALAEDNPFANVRVAVNRHQYSGRGCPVDLVFTGNINLAPHKGLAFQYHWERSDGAKSPVQVMKPGPGQRTVVVKEHWKLGGRGHDYDASATLHVASGHTHETFASDSVHIHCT